ncbi:hypothetical protein [Ilumatobacter sp.]|uniref:hypothetical protein n=1 Tax=Ilumatobacter sp. TaxID=1967498 RepID=UPI003B51A1F8
MSRPRPPDPPGDPARSRGPTEPDRTAEPPDGRRLKRERNIESVRAAVIELLSEGVEPRVSDIARRSGMTTRSVYRYFGDAEGAIASAVESRRDRAVAAFRSEPKIGRDAPLDERLALLVLRRLRLDRIVEPIGTRIETGTYVESLDAEVREAFAVEIAERTDGLAETLCGLFRLRTVRSMRDAFGGDDVATTRALCRLVTAVIDQGGGERR